MKTLNSAVAVVLFLILSVPAHAASLSCVSLFAADLDFKYHSTEIIEEDSSPNTKRFNIYMTNFNPPENSSIRLMTERNGTKLNLQIEKLNDPEALLYIANQNITKSLNYRTEWSVNEFNYQINSLEKTLGVLLKLKVDQDIMISFFIQRTRRHSDSRPIEPNAFTDWIETKPIFVKGDTQTFAELPWNNMDFPEWITKHGYEKFDSIIAIGLRIQKVNAASTHLKINFDGPIVTNFSFKNLKSEKIIYNLFQYENLPIGVYRKEYQKFSQDFISKIVRNLYLPENISYARQILNRGTDAIHKELQSLGLDVFFLKDKIEPVDFFNSVIKNWYVPIETSGFKEYHGEYSHALQVIAMTRNMSPQEKDLFLEFYHLLHLGEPGWVVWNILFDSETPDEPTNPHYWLTDGYE